MTNTGLLAAIQQRKAAQVTLAIARGAQSNAHDARGYTPFHVALLTADAPTARALLDNGADPLASTKLAQGRSMGAKTLVAYRHGRAHAHRPGSRERDAEFTVCDATGPPAGSARCAAPP